jgi:serine/threonine protein kinase
VFWEKIVPNDRDECPCARIQHSTIFFDGKMFMFGGKTRQSRLNDLWTLDTLNFTWKRIRTYGIPPSPRYGHEMMACGSNLYIFGGYAPSFMRQKENFPSEVIKFNLKTFEWSLEQQDLDFVPLKPRGRHNTSSIIFCKNRLLVFGGVTDQDVENVQSIERLNDLWILEFQNEEIQDPDVMIMGTYVIKRVVGSDTFGEIYLATHETEGEDYFLRRVKFKGKDDAQPLMNYVGTFARINHPNIARIVASWVHLGNEDRSIVIVIQKYTEGTLSNFLTLYRTSLTERDVLQSIVQILSGLAHLHSFDLVHRDLNPKSIYVHKKMKENAVTHKEEPRLRYKIANFGFEKTKDAKSFSILSQKSYNAPEMDKSCSKESDVWSVALLISYILTNEDPPINPYTFSMNQKGQVEKLENCLKKSGWKRISDYTTSLIVQCLNVNPTERPTAQFLFDEFNTLMQSFPSQTEPTIFSPQNTQQNTETSVVTSTIKSIQESEVYEDDGPIGGSLLILQNIGRSTSASLPNKLTQKSSMKRATSTSVKK